MKRFGILDLGSNTIRLCIYEVPDEKTDALTKQDITTLLDYKVMAGLASFVTEGIISKKGIKKAVSTIKAHLRRASHFNCEELHIFATAVIRNCTNSKEAAGLIEQACNMPLTILSNSEEAHLGFVGARLDKAMEEGILVDIGGGSTELTLIRQGNDAAKVSIAQGSLSSYATYVAGIVPTIEEAEAIGKAFEENLLADSLVLPETQELFGIGGSIRSAAKVYGDVCNEGNRLGYLLPEHIHELFYRYQTEPDSFLHQALQTIPDRIHTFIPGCALIREIFERTQAEKLTIAKTGIREGYLVERILKQKS